MKFKKKRILAITGLPGSGKTSAIEAIKDLGIVITMGDIVRDEAVKRKVELNGENLGKIAKELRENEGNDIIAKKCVEYIKNLDENIIFIDGLRSLSEVEVFKKYWEFPIIAIVVDEQERFKRLFKRARSDDPQNIEDLRERDKREINFGLNKVLKNADYVIQNNSTIEDLKEKTRKLVLDIINNY